jgi:hypothetical protein
MKTGIFFHEEFRNKDWPIIGDKFRSFPGIMAKALPLPGVAYFESQPASDNVLLLTHTPQYLADVRKAIEGVSEGRYMIITHGGFRSDVAEYIFPRIVEILAG